MLVVDHAAGQPARSGQQRRDNPIAVTIVGCEVGFWVVLGGGLALRYLARASRSSTIVLLCVPVVDLVLLILVAIDLGRGTTATPVHGLAAVYLGVSVAFGHRMVAWADVRFAHRFAGGPAPIPVPKSGPDRVAWEWRTWGLLVVGAAVAAGTLLLLRYVVGTPEQTQALAERLPTVVVVVVIWFVVGPLWSTLKTRESVPRR